MKKTLTIATVLLAALTTWTFAADKGTSVTFTGHVVDTTCYIAHDATGPDHLKCAVMCAKKGIPLGIVDKKSDQLYLPLSTDHSNPNTPLMDFIEADVKVTGKVIEKSGMKGIVIEKIERAG